MATRIKLRRDTSANWTSANPILAAGETGFEVDTRMMKLGDGTTRWADLKYAATGDMRMVNSNISSDTAISMSNGQGDQNNWILSIHANTGTNARPIDGYIDSVAYDGTGHAFASGWHEPINNTATSGAFLVKTDDAGNVIWNRYYDEYVTYGWGMIIDHNDDIILLLSEEDNVSQDILLVKVAGTDGRVLWSRCVATLGDYDDYGTCIDIDSSNNIFMGGSTYNGNDQDMLIAKFNGSTGGIMWQLQVDGGQFPCAGNNIGMGIAVDVDDNVAVVGETCINQVNNSYIAMVKRSGVDGSLIWQSKLTYATYDNANDGGQPTANDIATDSQGNFYISMISDGSGAGIIKVTAAGETGWARAIGYSDYYNQSSSIVCDADDNVYMANTIYTENYEPLTQDTNYRWRLNVTKFSTHGTVMWQRFLRREQAVTGAGGTPGSFPYLPFGGQVIAVNDEHVLVGGTMYSVDGFYGDEDDQDWFTQPFMLQVDKTGTEFAVDGWHFEDSKLKIMPVAVASDLGDQLYDPIAVTTATLVVTNAPDVFGITNTDTTQLSRINQSRVNTLTFDNATLTLPEGGVLSLPRKTLGNITSIGNFDGSEGSNTLGNVWINSVVRDDQGNSFAAGAWYPQNTDFNNDNYWSVPLLWKLDDQGNILWQASTNLNVYSEIIDVAINPQTQNPMVVSLDGTEGFNVYSVDATDGLIVGNVTNVQNFTTDLVDQQWLRPTQIKVMSDGTPVVAGYINVDRVAYRDVTSQGAGQTGSSSTGVLVISSSTFNLGVSPEAGSVWSVYNTVTNAFSYIESVNDYGRDLTGFTATNVTGIGHDAYFWLHVDPYTGNYVTHVYTGGFAYALNDLLKIKGSLLGGVDGINDVYITVSSVSGDAITAVNTTGTASTATVRLQTQDHNIDFTVAGTWTVYQNLVEDIFIWTPAWNVTVGSTGTDRARGLAIDSDDNIIVSGYYEYTEHKRGSYLQTSMVSKFSNTGTNLWSVTLDGTEGERTALRTVVDSNDDIYVTMAFEGPPNLVKLSSTGTLIWSNEISDMMDADLSGLAVDGNDNVFMGGNYGSYVSHANAMLISKFDTDGTPLFMRQIDAYNDIYNVYNQYYGNAFSVQGDRLSVAATSDLPGGDSAFTQGFLANLPLDGTGQGDWGDWSYRAVEFNVDRADVQSTSTIILTNFTATIRHNTFVAVNLTTSTSTVSTLYADLDGLIRIVYDDRGGEINTVSRIVFEDGTEQTTSGQDIPQSDPSRVNPYGTNTGDYYLRLADRGHHVYKHRAGIIYVPDHRDVAFPIGTAITIVSKYNNVGIYPADNATIWGAGFNANNQTWWIPPRSMATLLKIGENEWMLAGAGLDTGYAP